MIKEIIILYSVCVDATSLSRDERSSMKLSITFLFQCSQFSQERKDGTKEMEMFGKNPEIIKMLFEL